MPSRWLSLSLRIFDSTNDDMSVGKPNVACGVSRPGNLIARSIDTRCRASPGTAPLPFASMLLAASIVVAIALCCCRAAITASVAAAALLGLVAREPSLLFERSGFRDAGIGMPSDELAVRALRALNEGARSDICRRGTPRRRSSSSSSSPSPSPSSSSWLSLSSLSSSVLTLTFVLQTLFECKLIRLDQYG